MSAQETIKAACTTPAEPAAAPPPRAPVPRLAPAPVAAGLLRALRRRWLLALAVGLLGAAITAAALWALFPSQYSAEVWLQVQRPPHDVFAPADADNDLAAYLRAQAALVKSPLVLTAALARPEVADLPDVKGRSDSLVWLDRITAVEGVPDQSLLRIRVTTEGQAEPAVLADAIGHAYVDALRERRQVYLRQLREAAQRAADSLREAHASLERGNDPRLTTAERDLAQVRADLRTTAADLEALRVREKLVSTLPAPKAVVTERLETDGPAGAVRKELARVEDLMRRVERVSAQGADDPLYKTYSIQRDAFRKQLLHRQKEIAAIVEREVRAKARAGLDDLLARGRQQVESLREREKALAADVERLQAARTGSPDLAGLRAAVADRRQALRKLDDAVQAVEAEGSRPSWVTWLGQATEPRASNREHRLQLTWGGAGGVFLFFGLMVSWLEFRTRRINTASDVRQALSLPVIGILPPVAGGSKGGATGLTGPEGAWEGPVAEAADALRTVLLRAAGNEARLVLVTSALPGEGKTSLASLLALSLARSWRKTLFIDGDLRKPTAHRQYGLQLEPGLSELLRGEVESGDVIQPTPAGRLWMMPAGRWDSHALQALAQEGSAALFRKLKEQYDFVVMDGPAVLPAADALLFSQYADAVLVTVRAGTSRLPAVHDAQQRLATLDAPVFGAVVMGAAGEFAPGAPSPRPDAHEAAGR